MNEEELTCPKCDTEEHEVKNKERIKEPSHQIITVETRQCKKCGHTYRVADNGVVKYYYS